jgi:ankyrin repeat protein
MAKTIGTLIDPKKKAIVLQRIKDGKAPFCATKPEPEKIITKPKKEEPMKEETVTGINRKKPISQMTKEELDTELLYTIQTKDFAYVKQLLEAGANPNAIDKNKANDNRTIIEAARVNSLKIARLLVKHGADVNQKGKKSSTALMVAAHNGHLTMARYLIDKGADVKAKDNEGETALSEAKKKPEKYHYPVWPGEARRKKQIAKLLRKHGARE